MPSPRDPAVRTPASETVDVASETMHSPALRPGVATLPDTAPARPRTSLGADATVGAEAARVSFGGEGGAPVPRSTVLPRVEGGAVLRDTGRLRYEHLKPLGEGAMGEVLLAVDQDIDRRVAIKRMRAEHVGTTSLLRFAQEVRTIGRLEHPNIVPVHDVGVDERGQHFFVMKYVEGETLERVIERLRARDPAYLRRFPFEVRANVFLGVLRAVQYAHARGIIHRDIKPANIMVGPFGEVMVMDWGLARPLRETDAPMGYVEGVDGGTGGSSLDTQHGTVMGTPHYMSPEQARGETDRIAERSDVFSLAVVFHEFVSLRHYLEGKTTVNEVLVAVATLGDHGPTLVDWVRDSVDTGAPMDYLHIVRRGMAPRAEDRYANAGEMAAAVEDLLAGRMKMQCHISATKRVMHEAMRAIDRHPLVATVLLAGGVASAFFGIFELARAVLHLAA